MIRHERKATLTGITGQRIDESRERIDERARGRSRAGVGVQVAQRGRERLGPHLLSDHVRPTCSCGGLEALRECGEKYPAEDMHAQD